MEKLPLIPGYAIHDSSVTDHRLLQKFRFLNGYRVVYDNNIGIGGNPIDAASSAFIKEEDTIHYDPSLTYGRVKEYAYQQFVPHYVLFSHKCLCFKAFFRQGVVSSPDEYFRIRHVNIIYFLEDDTLCVMEPPIDNAGFQQGKLVRRGKIVKNTIGDTYNWKDFNVGIDVCIYGVVYHIIDCDLFTKEFLNSQGIDVGDKEEPPIDPYTQFRASKQKKPMYTTSAPDDARRRFLEYDKMVLSFTATWNDDVYCILYFLTDDTIAIREIQKPNSGKDPVPMLLKRMKVPKDWKTLPSSYPAIYLECTDSEVVEYYTPKDFIIGETIFIFNRRFFLHNCDSFTRKYYSDMLGIMQPNEIPLPSKEFKPPNSEYKVPPHIKFGTPEDTYATCLSLIPKPYKKDVVRQLINFPKKLRYSMQMDAVHPEDRGRDFILEYNLSDGTIIVHELEKRNSGRREGCFLRSTLVPKPNTGRDNPEYYTPQDFFIGAKVNIFNHYFIICGADLFVYRYIQANPEKFSQKVQNNIRDYFIKQNLLNDDINIEVKKIQGKEETELRLMKIGDETTEDSSDMTECLKHIETQGKRKYEGEHGELRDRTPPPEELCPGLITKNSVESNQHHDIQILSETDKKKGSEVE